MKWALLPADNESFCNRGEWSGHGLDAAQLWLVQMVTAVVVKVPNRLRCLPSKAGQVLAADRCGISVICKWCRRAELVPSEEMTWLSQPFVPWLQGKWGQEYRGKDFTTMDASTLPEGTLTFWLLPKNIRSPWVPRLPFSNKVSPSPCSDTCGEPYSVFIYKIWTIFTHWNFAPDARRERCRAGKTTRFQNSFLGLNVWNHCKQVLLVRDQVKSVSKQYIPVISVTFEPKSLK